jgi:hypothetical protein
MKRNLNPSASFARWESSAFAEVVSSAKSCSSKMVDISGFPLIAAPDIAFGLPVKFCTRSSTALNALNTAPSKWRFCDFVGLD